MLKTLLKVLTTLSFSHLNLKTVLKRVLKMFKHSNTLQKYYNKYTKKIIRNGEFEWINFNVVHGPR